MTRNRKSAQSGNFCYAPITKRLRASAAKAGAKAVANALAKGIPVTVMRDGVLIQINPDRTETIVEALS